MADYRAPWLAPSVGGLIHPTPRNESTRTDLAFDSAEQVREVSGELSRHLAIVGRGTGARVTLSATGFRLLGAPESVDLARRVLAQLYAMEDRKSTRLNSSHT